MSGIQYSTVHLERCTYMYVVWLCAGSSSSSSIVLFHSYNCMGRACSHLRETQILYNKVPPAAVPCVSTNQHDNSTALVIIAPYGYVNITLTLHCMESSSSRTSVPKWRVPIRYSRFESTRHTARTFNLAVSILYASSVTGVGPVFKIEDCNQVLRFPAEGPWKHFGETRDLDPLLSQKEKR